MKALVVYESMYGNTRHVAEAIAEGLRTSIDTEVVLARDSGADDLDRVELIVVGGPTHAWGMSSRRTRNAATTDATKHPDHLLENASAAKGVREWLRRMKGHGTCRAVAFDTRLGDTRLGATRLGVARLGTSTLLTGSAARVIQRGLRTAGFSQFDQRKSFSVAAFAGPLMSGEIERARQWGEAMGREVLCLVPTSTLADFSHE